MSSLSILPIEILGKIFLYLQCPVAKLIKDEIQVYQEDYYWDITLADRRLYVKGEMPFYNYYFDKIRNPCDYNSFMKDDENAWLYQDYN